MTPAGLAVRNPRTGRCDHALRLPDRAALQARAAALRAAQPGWQALGPAGRARVLQHWAGILAEDGPLLDALVVDTGRLHESRLERGAVAAAIARWCTAVTGTAGQLLGGGPRLRASALPTVEIDHDFVPYPLLGVISPWNFPLLLTLLDAVPALLAGCAVLAKPSELTPRFVDPLQACIARVPTLAAVLHVVAGDASTGTALVDEVDALCFTGGTATGTAVASQCAQRLIPAFLELGGKDPAIVLAGADLDRAAAAIVWGACVNAGQSCLSIERVYVERTVWHPLVERLVSHTRALPLAHPTPADGLIGPIISARQAAIIEAQLGDARSRGASVACGGRMRELDGGLYCEPTVLTGVDHAMQVMREETFAPIVPVMAVADEEEAVALANDSDHGLSAAVFAGDPRRARAVAGRLHAGAVSIEDAALTALVHEGEKQSFARSGLGPSRMGSAALLRYGRRRAFLHNQAAALASRWPQPAPR